VAFWITFSFENSFCDCECKITRNEFPAGKKIFEVLDDFILFGFRFTLALSSLMRNTGPRLWKPIFPDAHSKLHRSYLLRTAHRIMKDALTHRPTCRAARGYPGAAIGRAAVEVEPHVQGSALISLSSHLPYRRLALARRRALSTLLSAASYVTQQYSLG
jgi:hypothetical protein